ncbi:MULTISPECIES: hypothetical protein [unclassified Frankia]|uniref:hypothetical protein n=1 Tax=unclassified Frankia TaxID=2632575 RepID=UPI002AD4852E|nr:MULTISPECIES: hypothetical protein [unclassified Frankia]
MSTITATATRVGVYLIEDQEYYRSPLGDAEVVADEHAHFADGTWSAYLLMTVVECPHCGQLYTTDSLGGVVVDTTTLVDSVVWADDPSLGRTADDDYLTGQIRELIQAEQDSPTPPAVWVPLNPPAQLVR